MATVAARWLALASTLTATGAVDTKRKVDTLPVYGAPPTAHWTGFVETDAASGSHLFYYLVESADEPASDPLIWWFNGGPGASSFAGLFSENGPLLLNDAGVLVDSRLRAWQRLLVAMGVVVVIVLLLLVSVSVACLVVVVINYLVVARGVFAYVEGQWSGAVDGREVEPEEEVLHSGVDYEKTPYVDVASSICAVCAATCEGGNQLNSQCCE